MPGENQDGGEKTFCNANVASSHRRVASGGDLETDLTADSKAVSIGLPSRPIPISVQSADCRISSFPRGQKFLLSFVTAPRDSQTTGKLDFHTATRAGSSFRASANSGA